MTAAAGSKRVFVVGMSGASGAAYGARLLEALGGMEGVETHCVVTRNARKIMEGELGVKPARVTRLATRAWEEDALDAPIASGSFRADGMAVVPCSMRTVAAIAAGLADNLLVRAADVTLKERRPLVLVVRETPLHAGHLERMLQLARLGAVILPASPGFYGRPAAIADLVDQVVGRVLDHLGVPHDIGARWEGWEK